jgi:hypothetical protein
MNIKEYIVPAALALLATMIIHNVFWSTKQSPDAPEKGTEFVAPATRHEAVPLNYEIDFDDKQKSVEKELTTVKTSYASIDFSNHGAVIDNITYRDIFTNPDLTIQTFTAKPDQKESGAFLVALDGIGATPLYYNLIDKKEVVRDELGDSKYTYTEVVYQAETENARITKTFIIRDDIPKIDFDVRIEPRNLDEKDALQARIFFPANNSAPAVKTYC